VTVVEPTGNVDVAKVALCAHGTIWAVPNTCFPTLKVTGPVGVTVGDVIVAVKVTTWACIAGFSDELIWALLVVSVTSWFKTGDLLPWFIVSPE